ncbi:MAG TPA: AAA family ATPase [Candidatus Nanopelagicales bacterium]|nr:AAA family ATPase [Candidatus Nanopelagicales bacterium]
MPRWFNTGGPCDPAKHYVLPALRRLPDVQPLIDRQSYFIVHAPRQTGKTTTVRALADELTREGRYAALTVSVALAAPVDDIGTGELAILQAFQTAAQEKLPEELRPPPWPEAAPAARLMVALNRWATVCPRPLVLFIDEIDSLHDQMLLSVLRQLHTGYSTRPAHFPSTIVLIGLRHLRDYLITSQGRDHLGTPSPFNVTVESLTLRNFTEEEVAELYQQHTDETGQRFEPEAVHRVFELTGGQPWLVNALARQLVEVLVTDRARAITADDVDRAREILIIRRDTHLDHLAERLREPRVRAVIEPILSGSVLGDVPEDDRQYVIDLGLLRRRHGGGLEITNPIYREVIFRALSSGAQDSLPAIRPTWLRPDGRLDADALLAAFVAFWRRHGEALFATAPYHEIAPHLVLMAFLHRVVNGGGTLEREVAIGSGRMDLCLRYGPDTLAMELKVWRDHEADPLREGLEQLDEYLAGLGLSSGWLVIFDRRGGQPPVQARTTTAQATSPAGRAITVIRA